MVDCGKRAATQVGASSTVRAKEICLTGPPPADHSVLSASPTDGMRIRDDCDLNWSNSTVSSSNFRNEMQSRLSPVAATAIGIVPPPDSSLSSSIACPKSNSEDTRGSHISLVAVTARESFSSTEGQHAARSGCIIGSGVLFSEESRRAAGNGEGIDVFVIPAYAIKDASVHQ